MKSSGFLYYDSETLIGRAQEGVGGKPRYLE